MRGAPPLRTISVAVAVLSGNRISGPPPSAGPRNLFSVAASRSRLPCRRMDLDLTTERLARQIGKTVFLTNLAHAARIESTVRAAGFPPACYRTVREVYEVDAH